MENESIRQVVKESFSMNDLCIKLYGYCNGHSISKTRKIIENEKIDISHFGLGKKLIKYALKIAEKLKKETTEFKKSGKMERDYINACDDISKRLFKISRD